MFHLCKYADFHNSSNIVHSVKSLGEKKVLITIGANKQRWGASGLKCL